MQHRDYIEFLRHAMRASKRVDEAEDLLQTVLVAAIEADRADLSVTDNRKWVVGALRKRALFDARSATRRRQRETLSVQSESPSTDKDTLPSSFIATLPPQLRTTALLALTGHTKPEIMWLLRISDPTLRQRITQIRRRWRAIGGQEFGEIPGLGGKLDFGRIRQDLMKSAKNDQVILATHDPDGHLFILGSQNYGARQQEDSPKAIKE